MTKIAQLQKQIEHKTQMQPFKCSCGIVLGWTDDKMLAVNNMSFDKVVTGRCACCGKLNIWRPTRGRAA